MAQSSSLRRVVLSSGVYHVSYGFPSHAGEVAKFPLTNHFKANAWHHAFLHKDGERIVEWGDDNHSVFGWNSLRLIPIPHGPVVDTWRTDWLDPGDNHRPAVPSNYNSPRGVAHYNNHVELYNPKENWWFKVFGGGRYDLNTEPATLTHRGRRDPDGTEAWSGPLPGDFLRDDSHEQWFTGAAHNAIYNPAYDYHAASNSFLILGGGAGSDSVYDGCWIAEPNPEHPRQPQPWRIRNLRLVGAAAANYVPRYQWRAMGKFRQGTDWFYCWGGRLKQIYKPRPTVLMCNLGHRINRRTGLVEELPQLPVYIIDGGVAYDPDLDLFLIFGAPYDGPLAAESRVRDDWAVILYDPAVNKYTDVTPPGFNKPRHPLGAFKHPGTGRIYVRTGSGYVPPLPADQAESWKVHMYWWLKIEPA